MQIIMTDYEKVVLLRFWTLQQKLGCVGPSVSRWDIPIEDQDRWRKAVSEFAVLGWLEAHVNPHTHEDTESYSLRPAGLWALYFVGAVDLQDSAVNDYLFSGRRT